MTDLRRAFLVAGFVFLMVSLLAVVFTAQSPRSLVGHLDVFAATPTRSTPIPIHPTPTSLPSAPTPPPVDFGLRINELEKRLDDLGSLLEVQSNAFDATVSRMESNLNLLLTILPVVSLLTAVLGLGIVRVWIRSLVEDRLKDITSQEISRAVQEEAERIRNEWEPKFAALYEEYHRSMRK